MICLKLNWFFYTESRMLQFSQFVWSLRSSVWDVFKNVHLIDATDRSKISSDQKRFFIELSLYPLSFFANTPFKMFCFFLIDSLISEVMIENISNFTETWRKRMNIAKPKVLVVYKGVEYIFDKHVFGC